MPGMSMCTLLICSSWLDKQTETWAEMVFPVSKREHASFVSDAKNMETTLRSRVTLALLLENAAPFTPNSVSYCIKARNSSSVRLACRRIERSVPRATSLCIGTMATWPSLFVNETWLPVCRLWIKPARPNTRTTSAPDRRGSAISAPRSLMGQ
jgi:hypothetical protein